MKAVKPKKNLGQHFLTDLNIAKRIADTVDACPDILGLVYLSLTISKARWTHVYMLVSGISPSKLS